MRATISPARLAAAPYTARSPTQGALAAIHPDLDGAAKDKELTPIIPMLRSNNEDSNPGPDNAGDVPDGPENHCSEPTPDETPLQQEAMSAEQLADELGLDVSQIKRFRQVAAAFVCAKSRQKLLMPALQSYGRTHTVDTCALIPQTHLVLVKGKVDAMDHEWKTTYLPEGYVDHEDHAVNSVSFLIQDLLKYEKSALAKMVSHHSTWPGARANAVPIPQITDVVVTVLQEFSPRHALMTQADVAESIHISLVRQQDRTTTLV
ncbi:hypothetical protein PTTG_00793 [Puccinia triticina 1-1 BBBD Race 1]|uniref:Uncharacterized protein n=1 Tax=Puccinia triticina (isolate 1-1 / race 1 (BBBD)) TaxID=630390 RepID=A0A180G180_PUCT1|nr:hypothetical protein PTTG_00793 [Puccinia triticina 1-1 BBBD Race 1]